MKILFFFSFLGSVLFVAGTTAIPSGTTVSFKVQKLFTYASYRYLVKFILCQIKTIIFMSKLATFLLFLFSLGKITILMEFLL